MAASGPDILARAALVVGGSRLLQAVAAHIPAQAEQATFGVPLAPVMESIRQGVEAGLDVVVLADGDPLFFGIGKRLLREVGREHLRVIPAISTVQAAAAALRVPWEEVAPVSLHGRSDWTPLFAALARSRLVALYTDDKNSPDRVAAALAGRGVEGIAYTVLEDLGTPEERIRTLSLDLAARTEFSPLNIVIIRREAEPELSLGLGMDDDAFLHENGLLTKGPVRAAGLARLGVRPHSVVWDLGAGSGAVAVEAAGLATHGAVVAVERLESRAAMIRENRRRAGAWNLDVVVGELPGCLDECLKGRPDPDRIFIGGGLGRTDAGRELLSLACRRLASGGRLVVHCILLSSLEITREHLASLGWEHDIVQLQTASSDPLAGDIRFKGHNPVFILGAAKP